MKNQKTLVIWRDDHLADPIGALFLTAPEKLEDAVVEKLKEYLGARVRLLRVTIAGSRIEAEVESQGLHEESQRLVAAARGLRTKGLNRSAMATLKDALDLDPMNGHAYRELGATLAAAGQGREALAALIRAREALGDSAELLIEIARSALKLERTSAAIAYLERAHHIEPSNFLVRRALWALGRKQSTKPRPTDATAQEPVSSSGDAKPKAATLRDAGAAQRDGRKRPGDAQLPPLSESPECDAAPAVRETPPSGTKRN